MKLKLNKRELNDIEKFTGIHYDIKGTGINTDDVYSIIDELLYYLNEAERKYDEIIEDLHDNYRRIPVKDQVE